MRGKTIYFIYAALVIAYLGLMFFLPPDPVVLKRYGLSVSAFRWLNVAVAVPLMAIWLAAFYGYAKLKSYSQLIRSSSEGRAVVIITNGVMVLALGLPVAAVLRQIIKYVGKLDESLLAATTITTNYISLIFPLVAFILISAGTRRLIEIKKQRYSRYATHGLIALFAAISVGYSYFVLHYAFSDGSNVDSIYRMPLWLVLTTLVVPYIYMWFIGFIAAYEMYLYNSAVKGILYRRSWSVLSAGLGVVIIAQIVVQYLTTITPQLNRLSITAILLVVYALLLLMSVGYILVAYGAKKLQKIEEV